MSLNLTNAEQKRLAAANIKTAKVFGRYYLNNPEALSQLPPKATVFMKSDDDWVNQQNEKLAAKAEREGKTVIWFSEKDLKEKTIVISKPEFRPHWNPC